MLRQLCNFGCPVTMSHRSFPSRIHQSLVHHFHLLHCILFRMGDKQKAAARAPAAKRATGKRKAKKTTSTPKRVSNRQKKAAVPDSDDGEFIGSGDISIGDILMELPAREHASTAIDEDIETSDDDEIDEDFGKKGEHAVLEPLVTSYLSSCSCEKEFSSCI